MACSLLPTSFDADPPRVSHETFTNVDNHGGEGVFDAVMDVSSARLARARDLLNGIGSEHSSEFGRAVPNNGIREAVFRWKARPSCGTSVAQGHDAIDNGEERDALFRSVCYDMAFDHGEETNSKLLRDLEADFATELLSAFRNSCQSSDSDPDIVSSSTIARCDDFKPSSCSFGDEWLFEIVSQKGSPLPHYTEEDIITVLSQTKILGVALDLVAAYLKNFMLDRAESIIGRILPLCRSRGGMWLIKALNASAAVCCKQDKFEESLAYLKEIQDSCGLEPCDNPLFFDILYRNIGIGLLHQKKFRQALELFGKAAAVKRACGMIPSWMDQWDIAKTLAHLSQQENHVQGMRDAIEMLREVVHLHCQAEPDDKIMHAKILDSLGQTLFSFGEMLDFEEMFTVQEEGLGFLRGSLVIFNEACGTQQPLAGLQAQHVGIALILTGRLHEAKPFLLQALSAEAVKDTISIPVFAGLIDRLTTAHVDTGDIMGLANMEKPLNAGLRNIRGRSIGLKEQGSYVLLLHKISSVLLLNDTMNLHGAAELLEDGLRIIEESATCTSNDGTNTSKIHRTSADKQSLGVDVRSLLPILREEAKLVRRLQHRCQGTGDVRDQLCKDLRVRCADQEKGQGRCKNGGSARNDTRKCELSRDGCWRGTLRREVGISPAVIDHASGSPLEWEAVD